ncbi:arsenate reductase ArsC [Candidatus Woesearchaeota archaeon]|nr:arsenate reductase ArsC [Candidatus Woesearchaeota archaeon]
MEKFILFVCVGNMGRSQMAEGFFNNISKKYKSISAGINAVHEMSPIIIDVMKEIGIDISKQRPKQLVADMVESASRIIAMGDDVKKSNFLPVKLAENWHIPDPIGKTPEQLKMIRDMIKEKVEKLINELENGES